MEAGHVRIDRPAIIEVDTTRAIADGNTILNRCVSVFDHCMPSDYLYQVVVAVIIEIIARWEAEEEEPIA